MIPSPSELQYFVEVASTLNISRAAERLGISQPSLSQAVKRLEDGLGVPLLIRSKAGVQLTRTGQRFVAQARLLLAEWDRIAGEAVREESQVTGRYVIGCHVSVALYTLPHFLPSLIAQHPSLEVKLVHGLSRQITDEVIGFKVDFGIVVNPTQHPDLVIKVLAKDDVLLWSAGDAAKDVGDVLVCDPDLLQTQAILKQMEKKGHHFRRTVTSGSLEVIAALTAAGAGVGILPTRIATREGGLEPLAESPKHQDKICLVYRADAQNTAARRVIGEALQRALS